MEVLKRGDSVQRSWTCSLFLICIQYSLPDAVCRGMISPLKSIHFTNTAAKLSLRTNCPTWCCPTCWRHPFQTPSRSALHWPRPPLGLGTSRLRAWVRSSSFQWRWQKGGDWWRSLRLVFRLRSSCPWNRAGASCFPHFSCPHLRCLIRRWRKIVWTIFRNCIKYNHTA